MAILGITSEGGLIKGLLQLLRADSGTCQQSNGPHPLVILWASLCRPPPIPSLVQKMITSAGRVDGALSLERFCAGFGSISCC